MSRKTRSRRSCLLCGASGSGTVVMVPVCRDDLALLQGLSGLEEHHPEGRANSPETVPLPVSIHAPLTANQAKWVEALRIPSRDPVLGIARRTQAMRAFAEWFLKATRRDVPWLTAFALDQQDAHGPNWWKKYPIAPLDPKDAEE